MAILCLPTNHLMMIDEIQWSNHLHVDPLMMTTQSIKKIGDLHFLEIKEKIDALTVALTPIDTQEMIEFMVVLSITTVGLVKCATKISDMEKSGEENHETLSVEILRMDRMDQMDKMTMKEEDTGVTVLKMG
mmetsp:Transcript_27684/g.65000  ORF Transcript_27684/g.65000 Transcript_27684/m.65000 type:complete len:132 (+) Transcript_27684:1810-2205(+)